MALSPAALDAEPLLRGLRIVIVEDDTDSREMLDELLSFYGADVQTAADAAAGISTLARFKPAVLLSDIGLPGEDGFSMMRRCRKLATAEARVPAIAVTAFCREQDRAECFAAGFDDYAPKPLDVSDLVQRILRVVGRAN